jgi:HlyD family secretion protein
MREALSRLRNKWIWPALVLAALVIVIAPRIFRKAVPVPFVIVQPRTALETVLATGRVVGEKTIPLSFPRPGRIAEELIKDGDAVPSERLLMRQDNRHEEQALVQSRNALETAKLQREKLRSVDIADAEEKIRQARANASYASDFFKRQTELWEQKTITLLQFEQSRRDKELADSALAAAQNQILSLREVQSALADLQIARAESDLRRAELDLQDTFLRAPYAGRIVSHDAHKSEFVGAGQKIVTFIPDTPRTYIEIQVDETNAGKFALGQTATVSSPAFRGRTFAGAVERIAPIVDAQRGSFAVRLALERFEPDLLPESSVSVQVVLGEIAGAILLEQRFVIQEGGRAFVFTAENGRARRIPVTVRDLGNGLFDCRPGLRDGQTVLLPQGLIDGLKIKPVPITE